MNNPASRLVAVGLAVVVAQQLLMSHVKVFGVHPDVLLGFALVVGITGGASRGAAAGLVAGIITDAMTSPSVGAATISYTLTAFAAGALSDDTTDYPWVVFMSTLGGSIAGTVAYAIVGGALGDVSTSALHVVRVALIVAVINAALSPLAARPLRSVWKRRKEYAW